MLLGSRDKSSTYAAQKYGRYYSPWSNPINNMKWFGQIDIYK